MSDITPGKPFSAWEWSLAFRYLRNKRKNGGVGLIAGVAFVAIALAITAMITVMSVMSGFRSELLGKILDFNGHIYVQGQAAFADNYPTVAERLKAIPGVVRVTPLIQSQTLVVRGSQVGAMVRGVTPQDLKNTHYIADHLIAGSMTDFGKGEYGGDTILIGAGLAESLNAHPGEFITLYGASTAATPFSANTVSHKDYLVGGVFKVGMNDYDQAFIMMPLEQAQIFFGRGQDIDLLEVDIQDPEKPEAVDRILPKIRAASVEGSIVSDWRDRNAAYWGALKVERFIIRFIMLLVVAMAALNIISALVMLVKNKERDIAVLRTIGAGRGAIMRIFLISGAMIGVTATPVGVLAGVLICKNLTAIQHGLEAVFQRVLWSPEVYFLSSVPVKLDWTEVTIVALWTFGISVLATIYPSWRASRTDPVEALRYE
ncbi:MAG: lipoprotein-releasing ABC transporter permease subunit [Alphaproteobacteria bacterium]